jgi:hypothetical protein
MAIRSFTAESEMQLVQINPFDTSIREWGGWMDAVPSLLEGANRDVLSPAVRTLAAALTTRQKGPTTTTADYLKEHGSALRVLQGSLREFEVGSRFALLTTIMCLYVAEVCSPESFSVDFEERV